MFKINYYELAYIGLIFIKTYADSGSIFISILTSIITLCCWITALFLWKSKLNIVIKTFMAVCFVGCLYYTFIRISEYRAKRQIEYLFTKEKIDDLKLAYKNSKENNIEEITLETIDRLKEYCDKDTLDIEKCFDELHKIDMFLSNPFIANYEYDIRSLQQLRGVIFDTLRKYGEEENQDFLQKLYEYDNYSHLIIQLESDPVRFELYKALIEQNPRELIQFFEKLFTTEDGQIKIKKLLHLQSIEVLHSLNIYLDDQDEFEQIVKYYISKSFFMSTKGIDTIIHKYIFKILPTLLKSSDGRKKIIQDMQKIADTKVICLNAICEVIIKKDYVSQYDLYRKAEKEVILKMGEIFESLGKIYE